MAIWESKAHVNDDCNTVLVWKTHSRRSSWGQRRSSLLQWRQTRCRTRHSSYKTGWSRGQWCRPWCSTVLRPRRSDQKR